MDIALGKIVTSRKGRVLLAAMIAACLAVAGIVISRPAVAASETLTFNIDFRKAESTDVDANNSGKDDVGDYFTGEFLLDKGGQTRGFLEFVCHHTSAHPKRDHCVGTARIAGRGQIALQGPQASNVDKFVGPITGGTGDFQNASGTVYLDFTDDPAKATFRVVN
jgi:hypothetical protein